MENKKQGRKPTTTCICSNDKDNKKFCKRCYFSTYYKKNREAILKKAQEKTDPSKRRKPKQVGLIITKGHFVIKFQ